MRETWVCAIYKNSIRQRLVLLMQKGERMNDLISRQAAIDAIEPTLKSILQGNSFKAINVIDKIRDLPSVQTEIIRCKDCKHYQFADNRAFGMPVKMCKWFGFEDVDDDDFCSRAERRTDEAD